LDEIEQLIFLEPLGCQPQLVISECSFPTFLRTDYGGTSLVLCFDVALLISIIDQSYRSCTLGFTIKFYFVIVLINVA